MTIVACHCHGPPKCRKGSRLFARDLPGGIANPPALVYLFSGQSDLGVTMGRQAANVVTYNDLAIKKRVKEGSGQPQREWRVVGGQAAHGLVLITQPSGNGVFYLFYRGEGGANRKLRIGEFGPLSLHSANKLALERRTEIANGGDPKSEADAVNKAIKFRELTTRFLASGRLAASTKVTYQNALSVHAFPEIGDLAADKITSDHIVRICQNIEATGATTQADRVKATIGGVFRYGRRERLTKGNPCAGIGKRGHSVKRSRTPTDAEIVALWRAVSDPQSKLSPSMRAIFKIALLTGQRRTEVAGCGISEVGALDGKEPVWTIPGDTNKRGKLIEGRTKNGREQIVPLAPQVTALFREAIETCADDTFVFPADLKRVKVGKTPRTPHINGESVSKAVRRLRLAIGIDDITIHDLRRGISNYLKNQGVSREVRDLILNHLDQSVTESTYTQDARMLLQVRAALTAWADHVWRITEQSAGASNVVSLRA